MTNLREFLTRFSRSESGATLVEYGIALFVAITVGGALLTGLAGTTEDNFGAADRAASEACGGDNPPSTCTDPDADG